MFWVAASTEQRLASAAKLFQPARVFRRKFSFQLFAYALRECGTKTSGRNRDLKLSPAHDRRIVEIAMRWVVHDIAQNSAGLSLVVDSVVQINRRRRRDHEK